MRDDQLEEQREREFRTLFHNINAVTSPTNKTIMIVLE